MSEENTVTVPRWALQFVMERACFMDAGPRPEGWRSDQMESSTNALEKALREEAEGGGVRLMRIFEIPPGATHGVFETDGTCVEVSFFSGDPDPKMDDRHPSNR